jgi:hypothetical protein
MMYVRVKEFLDAIMREREGYSFVKLDGANFCA